MGKYVLGAISTSLLCLVPAIFLGCRQTEPSTIAVIPRTTGVQLWESEHAGAEIAATQIGAHIYWNAPTREDDVERQVAMVEDVIRRKDKGLILAPDQALALMTPVYHVLAHDIPTVIVGSSLTIPAGGSLRYVLNDDVAAGRLAAERIGVILHGHGPVAVIGLDPDIRGTFVQTRTFEAVLAKNYPDIHIVEERNGAFNGAQARETTEEVLATHPGMRAIFALTSVSTRAAYLVLQARGLTGKTLLVGNGQDLDMLADVKKGGIDSLLIENTWQMGYQAVQIIHDLSAGRAVRGVTTLEPLLVTAGMVDKLYSSRWLDEAWASSS